MVNKQHIPFERYHAWSACYPLFQPLTSLEKEAATEEKAVFEAKYKGVRLFPDPFLEVSRTLPAPLVRELQISAPSDPFLQSLATKLASEIKSRWGATVPIITDDAPEKLIQSSGPLLLLGGSDRNRASMEISKKYQIGPFCSECPGPGGWGLTTHRELEAGMAPRYVLACDDTTSADAIAAFLTQAIDASASAPVLKWVHLVSPGPELKKALPDFDTWMESVQMPAERLRNFPRLQKWLASGRVQPYREIFRDILTHDLVQYYWDHGALPANGGIFDVGLNALRFYQWTGDEKALAFFRETMWGLWDYLNSQNPQIYISDIDFRLGPLCNEWNWIEHHPALTSEERQAFTLALLGSMRMANGYFEWKWKNASRAATNHRTFKARTLILGWRYFRRWNLPDLQEWKENAAFVFNEIDSSAFKYHEDAVGYEIFVPEHLLVWFEATGQAIPEGMQQALAWFAKREWAMTDNFFGRVDYGDSEPLLRPRRPFEVAPWLSDATTEQAEIKAIEASTSGVFPVEIPPTAAVRNLAGLHHGVAEKPFPSDFLMGWTRIPMDPSFAATYQAAGTEETRFDKLAWRSGWQPESAYLAFSGTGKGAKKPFVSHAHHEANSILRMNLGGRIWLVNNGYGKSDKALPAAVLFKTRKIGPEDHNTLVVRDPSSGAAMPPPFNALLKDKGEEPVPFSVTQLNGYGGVNWQRNLFILPEIGLLVIDHAVAADGNSALPPLELQWNLLGERSGDEDQSRLEQNGVVLEFKHFGSTTAAWRESGITVWRGAIQSGAYAHTKAMPNQCILTPRSRGGRDAWFVNGLWLADSVASAQWDQKERTFRVTTKKPLPYDGVVERPWGSITTKGNSLTLAFH